MYDSILKDNRFKVFFAVFVMVGWSLAYPLIKLGYQEFQITALIWEAKSCLRASASLWRELL